MAGLLLCLFSGEVLAQTADTIVDWAASANGGVASVSSTVSSADYPAASLNDGAWLGSTWGHGDGWRAASKANEWAQVTFATAQTIHAVTLYSAPDGVVVDADGIDARTFTRIGAVEFDVQVSNGHGNNWKTVAHVSGNHLIKRSVSFAPVSAGAVRVVCTSGGTEGIGLVELEAWGASGIGNVALPMASKNKNKTPTPTATITADSASEELYPATAMVDGIVDGKDWGKAATGGWMSAGEGAFPTTVELAFEKPQVLDAVTLWTLQDDYEQGTAPTDSTTFTKWGLTAFDVQVWRNGWVTVAQITDNNLVKRTVTFAPTAAMRLRIVAQAGLAGAARIVELQAWGVEMTGLPRLTGLRPQQAAVGETVTLSGENFSRIATADRVLFNGIAGEVIQASATSLSVRIPSGATTGRLSLTINGIESKTGGDFTIASASKQTGNAVGHVAAASVMASGTGPTIDNFSPAKGAPDTTVTIVGSGFDPNPSNNTVLFGDAQATVLSASSSALSVKVPFGLTGYIHVVVAGVEAISAGYYYFPPYSISFTPLSGPAETTLLTIKGNEVVNATVNFTGGVSSSSNMYNWNTVNAWVANGAQTGPITLTKWDMTSAPSLDSFTVTHPAPTITSFAPTSGKPGDVIQINGTNLSPTIANNVVKFNGVTATISGSAADGRWLNAVVPMTATTGKISVTKDGQTATSSGTFTVNPLAAQAAAFVAQTPPPSTMIAGQTAAVSVTMQNIGSTTWTAGQLYRLGSQNGVDWGVGQRVALPNDVAYGQTVTFNFTVTAPATPGSYGFVWQMLQDGVGWFGTIAPSAAVTVTPVTLSASGVSPISASVDQSVTISGTGFSSTTTANTVKFTGSATAATVTAASSNALTVTVPGDASPGPITVTVNGQSATTPDFYLVPVFNGFTPTQGPIGTSVTINGTGFGASQGTSIIAIGVTIMSVSSWTSTRIVATIPNSASTNPFSLRDGMNRVYSSSASFSVAPPVPTISSLSVTHGMVGDSVIFTGTNFSTAAGGNVVTFNGVASTSVTSMTSTRLTATVPLGATSGPVGVSVGISTGTGPSFTVDATPAATCTSATPQSPSAPTNAATQRIFAYGVQNATNVQFPTWWVGENNANDLQWLPGINAGGGTWYVDVPHAQYDPGNPRYGQFITRVWMTNPAYNNGALQQCGVDAWWTWQAPLTITGISPASASIGQSVVISGTGFDATATNNVVRFSGTGVNAQVTAVTSTQLTVVVPPNATSGAITVTVGSNTVTTTSAFFTLVPVLNGFTPTTGPPGQPVIITGSGFGAAQVSSFTYAAIGSSALAISTWSDTQITGTVQKSASTGAVTVRTAEGKILTGGTFIVTTPAPLITGVSPNSGSIGALVRIDGANFSAAANGNVVKFNGVTAGTLSNVSDAHLTVAVPAGASTGPITITVGTNTATSPSNFTVPTQSAAFVSQTVPTTMMAGQSYPVSVTMQNTGSATWTAAQNYKLDAQNPQDNSLWGVSRVTVPNDVPSGQNVTFTFTVTAPTTTGTYNFQWGMLQEGVAAFGAFTDNVSVTVNPVTLSITGIAPTQASVGDSIVINGTGFVSGSNQVLFGGSATPATITAASANAITVTVPGGISRSAPIAVTVGSQSATTPSFYLVPTFKDFSPATGPTGTHVTITGTGFGTTQSTQEVVGINGRALVVTSWSDTQIVGTIPNAVSTGSLIFQDATAHQYTIGTFTVTPPPPTITKISPTHGAPTAAITITGQNFGATIADNTVAFNGVNAMLTAASTTSITALVPYGAGNGPIAVTTTYGMGQSAAFTYDAPPPQSAAFVSQVAPPTSLYAGQTATVSVTMQNTGSATWTTAQGYKLGAWNGPDFGIAGRVALPNDVGSGQTVAFAFTITAPAAPGTYSYQWGMLQEGANWFGTKSDLITLTVTQPPPTIGGFTPTQGSVGDTITITGTNFSTQPGQNLVTFNGVAAPTTSGTATTLTAAVPNGAGTGPLGIRTNGVNGDLSKTNFTVIALPQTIAFGAQPGLPVGQWSTLSATGGPSGQPVVFTTSSSTVCQITGYQILGLHVGSCVVTANQAGNPSYSAASPVTQTVTVTQGPQTITLSAAPTISVGGVGSVRATGGASGNPVIFNTTTPTICTLGTASTTSGVSTVLVNGLAQGTCTIVANQAGNADYQAAAQATQTFSIIAPPTVTGLSPNQGPPDTEVTISGSNFSPDRNGNIVTFGGWQASITAANPTYLKALVPRAASGTVAVVVTVGSQSAYAGPFTVTPAPKVKGFSPFGGKAGDTVTITGDNFAPTASGNLVSFNGATTTPTQASATELTVIVPAGASTGPISVTIAGQSGSSADSFLVLAAGDFPSTAACGTSLPPINPGTNPGRPGLWQNPKRAGTGWDLHFNGSGDLRALTWYTFDGDGRPTFLSNLGAAVSPSSTNLYYMPLYKPTADLAAGTTSYTRVGQAWIVFVPGSNTNAAIRWQWDAVGSPVHDECIYDFWNAVNGTRATTRANSFNVVGAMSLAAASSGLSASGLDESYTALWSPNTTQSGVKSGWGVASTVVVCPQDAASLCTAPVDVSCAPDGTCQHTFTRIESDVVTIYDTAGQPVWLTGTILEPTTAEISTPLDYGRSKYPGGFPLSDCAGGCTTHNNLSADITQPGNNRNDTGTLTRSFASPLDATMTLVASVPNSITGAAPIAWPMAPWMAKTPMQRLTDNAVVLVNQPYCATNCEVIVSWLSGVSGAQLYKHDLVAGTTTLFAATNTGSQSDQLLMGDDVQYELRSGGPTGTLIFQSAEVKVGSATPKTPLIVGFQDTTGAAIASGPVGSTVVVTGANFDPTPGNNAVQFNHSSNAVVQSATTTTLTVVIPNDATTGTVTVTVNGRTGSSPSPFTIGANAPSIDHFSPDHGNAGTQVQISGKNFSPTATVMFTGTATPAAIVGTTTATQITVTVPAGVATGPITVTVGGITVTSSTPFTVPPVTPQGTPVSATPVTTSTPATDPVSDAVGATAAQFRVDEGGNATYSIPIQVPPGTAGVVPKLALSYNSRLPSGVMGPGWAIQGASQISRCRQTRESGDFGQTDGNPPAVDFTQMDDRFCLDGARLLMTSGSIYGASGTVYAPENDPTTKVTVGVSNAAIGPDTFTVQRKDGTTSTYGNTSASVHALSAATPLGASTVVNVNWNLARVQDSAGNYIDYLYNAQPGTDKYSFLSVGVETTLAQVNYTGNVQSICGPQRSQACTPYASITFNYATLSNSNTSPSLMRMNWQAGVLFAQTQQLQSVTVSDTTNGTVRYYALGYGPTSPSTVANSGSGSGQMRLMQVTECRDSSQKVCFNPTTFTWSAANNQLQEELGPGEGSPDIVGMKHLVGLKVADVDGDGRMDLVWATDDGSCKDGNGHTISRINVGFLDTSSGTSRLNFMQGPCATIDLASTDTVDNNRAWYLTDLDGDGRADLLIGGGPGSHWQVFPSLGRSGTVFDQSRDLLSGLANPIVVPDGMNAVGVLADVNGDGIADFITPNLAADTSVATFDIPGGNAVNSGLSVRLGTRTGTFQPPFEIILTLDPNDTKCRLKSNFNCTINFLSARLQNSSFTVADINGDGRADMTFLLKATPCSSDLPTVPGVPKCDNGGAAAKALSAASDSSTSTPLPLLNFDPTLGMDVSATDPAATTGASIAANTSPPSYYWYQFTANGISQPSGVTQPILLMQVYAQLAVGSAGPNNPLPTTVNKFFIVDLNGDGLADILYQNQVNGAYTARINQGNGTYSSPVDFTAADIVGDDLNFLDVNGDGRTDLVYHGNSRGCASCQTPYSFVSVIPDGSGGWTWTVPAPVPGVGLHDSSASITWIGILGDFDGDGVPDLFQYEFNPDPKKLAVYNYSYSRAISGTSRYRPRDAISRITNGLGAATSLVYQPLTNIGVYHRGGASGYPALTTANYGWGSPVFDVLAPMYVVSQAISSAPTQNDPGATSTVSYRYTGATMQAGGRGFLGFREVWAFDANDAATTGQYVATVNRYAQHYPFIGMPVQTIKTVLSGTAVNFGNSWLTTCASNIEATNPQGTNPQGTGDTCFAQITGSGSNVSWQYAWPDLTASGTLVSQGQQTPACVGPGCAAGPTTAQCSIGGGVPTFTASASTGFTAPSTAGPIFAYVAATGDTQYDLGSGTPGHPAAYTSVFNQFCYDGSTSSPSKGDLLNSVTITTDGVGTVVAQKATANTYTDDATKWFLGRLSKSVVSFSRPSGVNPGSRTTSFTYDTTTTGQLTSERIQSGGRADQDLRTLYTLDGFGNRTGAYQCSSDVSDTQCLAGAANTANIAQRQTGATVLRYAKTAYDDHGRYVTGSTLPFATATGGWNEQQATTIWGRDEFGNAVQQSSLNGTQQTALFGVLGRPYFTSDNVGHASTTTYHRCGRDMNCGAGGRFVFRAQTITAGGASTWTYFDALGRPVMKVAQSFDANPAGQQFTASCGFTDAHNRLVYQSEPFFLNVAVAGDGSPVLTGSPCNGAAYATTTTYDVLGRAVSVTTPDGTTNTSYVGLSTWVTNARGFTWETTTNPLGEVVETDDPGLVTPSIANATTTNLKVTQAYDQAGNLAAITRNAGSGAITSSFTYDALGRKTQQIDTDSGTASFTYNAAGEIIGQTDANNQTIALSFDALGRKWQRVASGAGAAWTGTITDSWSYDTASNGYGQLANEVHNGTGDQNLTRAMIYDGYGRLYQRQHVLSGSGTYTETTALDGYGRPWQQQDATGQVTTTHYSARGFADRQNDSRLTAAAQSGTIDAGVGGRLYELLKTNERGQPVNEQRGGSTKLQTSLNYYAQDGRLKGVCTNGSSGTCGLQDDQYAYDAVGNVTARLKNASSGKSPVEQLTYDALNRLTQAQLGAWSGAIDNGNVINVVGTQAMTYDVMGNLCTQSMTGSGVTNTTQTYTYAGPAGCANHGSTGSAAQVVQITGTATQTYSYDANGNQTSRGDGRLLTYNALNQAVKAVLGSNTTTFQYGPDGDRYLRNDNGTLTLYIGKVEITIAGGVTTEQKRYLGGAIDLVVANDTRYVLTDHLGSTNVIAHADGTQFEGEAFDAWGNRRDPGTWTQAGVPAPITTTMHGFTGQEGVEAMGIIHFNGRIYDPSLGRMLQADPVQNPGSQGLNRYAYVANNPLTLTDPTGYSFWNSFFGSVVHVVVDAALWASGNGWAIPIVDTVWAYAATNGNLAATAAAFIASNWGPTLNEPTGGWQGLLTDPKAFLIAAAGNALRQGILQGTLAALQGQSFGSAFRSAAISSFASSFGPTGSDPTSGLIRAMIGGTASALSGGKFANGAITALAAWAAESATEKYEAAQAQKVQKQPQATPDTAGSIAWQLWDPLAPTVSLSFSGGIGQSTIDSFLADASNYYASIGVPINFVEVPFGTPGSMDILSQGFYFRSNAPFVYNENGTAQMLGVNLSVAATSYTFIHEIGHTLGLLDQYINTANGTAALQGYSNNLMGRYNGYDLNSYQIGVIRGNLVGGYTPNYVGRELKFTNE